MVMVRLATGVCVGRIRGRRLRQLPRQNCKDSESHKWTKGQLQARRQYTQYPRGPSLARTMSQELFNVQHASLSR